MHPTICQIGPFTVYSYGLMLATALFVCMFLLQKEARRRNLDPGVFVDIIFWIAISGILGSRVFFIALNWPYFFQNPAEVFMLQNGGLAFQGGLVFGTLTAVFLIKKNKLPFWQTLDFLAPYAALGQSIGRIGCFLNGCCYGKPVSWGIYFPVHGARLHPTQLYDAFGLFIIFLLLKQLDSRKKESGEIFILYLLLASSQRFLIEFFRADHEIFLWGLSIFQVVSLFVIAAASYAYPLLRSRRTK